MTYFFRRKVAFFKTFTNDTAYLFTRGNSNSNYKSSDYSGIGVIFNINSSLQTTWAKRRSLILLCDDSQLVYATIKVSVYGGTVALKCARGHQICAFMAMFFSWGVWPCTPLAGYFVLTGWLFHICVESPASLCSQMISDRCVVY